MPNPEPTARVTMVESTAYEHDASSTKSEQNNTEENNCLNSMISYICYVPIY